MLPFGKDKAATKTEKEWQAWNEECIRLASESIDIETSRKDAEKEEKNAAWMAKQAGRQALSVLGVKVHQFPESELPRPDEALRMLQSAISRAEQARENRTSFNLNISDANEALDDLQTALRGRDEAASNAQALAERLAETTQRLEALKGAPPKAGKSALSALDNELTKSQGEAARIRSALDARRDPDGGAEALALAEVEQAQQQVDDLEAAAALGDVGEEETQAANARLERARNKLGDAKAAAVDAAERQSAASRGLTRQLERLEERIVELENVRASVAREVYREELEAVEIELVALIDNAQVRGLVENINALRGSLNQAINHLNGNAPRAVPVAPLKLRVDIEYLFAHPEARALNSTGIKL